MFANDSAFWVASDLTDALNKSWGDAKGNYAAYVSRRKHDWDHHISRMLGDIDRGRVDLSRVVEFGCGLGILDDLLGESTTEILMLDGNDSFISKRPLPIKPRCTFKTFDASAARELRTRLAGHFTSGLVLNVLYHLDDQAVLALSRVLLESIQPGGHLVLYGYTDRTADTLRTLTDDVLFQKYAEYSVDMRAILAMLGTAAMVVYQASGFAVLRRSEDH